MPSFNFGAGLSGHSGDEEGWTEGTREMLDDMHLRKIDLADRFRTNSGAQNAINALFLIDL